MAGQRKQVGPAPATDEIKQVRWKRWAVALEVDGIQHVWVQNLVADALRHNYIAVSGDVVLRLPVLGLRVCPDAFFAQLESALVRAGWDRPRRSA